MSIEDAIKVAQRHYDLLQQEDKVKWAETICKSRRKGAVNRTRGDSADFWWDTGRRYWEQYGVYYKFDHVDREKPDYCKLFFKRFNRDGSQRGQPVPIHLIKEDGEWKVETGSY
ncbi:MAG: hypothetical protein K9W43_05155 [Candidatus Thorarchaeota archaeon]|nr:hypothetical protein [Candidatus Thorarchaeota archaeon]